MQEPRDLPVHHRIAYGVPQIPLALTGALIVPWLTYFYVPPAQNGMQPAPAVISAWLFAALMLGGRFVDAFADPLIGYLSDRCTSRWGRRMPFIVFGTPVLAVTFGALWFPPFEPGSTANAVYVAVVMSLFWIAFTAVVAPYVALLPEIATTTKLRVALSSYMGVFMLIGTVVGALMIGPLQSNYREGFDVLGIRIPSGLQFAGLIGALSVGLFLLPCLMIKESGDAAQKQVPAGLWKGVASTFKNPSFRTLISMATLALMGMTLVVTIFPYLMTRLVTRAPGEAGWVQSGQGEAWTGYLMALLVLSTGACIPAINKLVPRFGKKRLMLAAGYCLAGLAFSLAVLPLFPEPALPMILFAVGMGFPTAGVLILVNPIYADVVDRDEEVTGYRREGIYTGSMAVLSKASLGIANALAVMFISLDDSGPTPWSLLLAGPFAALLLFLGTSLFRKHQVTE